MCEAFHSERRDMTILAISHQPALVGLADKLYRIADGRLWEEPHGQRAAD